MCQTSWNRSKKQNKTKKLESCVMLHKTAVTGKGVHVTGDSVIIRYDRGIQGRHSHSQARMGRYSQCDTLDCLENLTT